MVEEVFHALVKGLCFYWEAAKKSREFHVLQAGRLQFSYNLPKNGQGVTTVKAATP